MAKADPARRLSPPAGVGVSVRTQNGGRNGRTVGRDAVARVKKIACAEIHKSLFCSPAEDFAANIRGRHTAIGGKSEVDPRIAPNVEHAECRRGRLSQRRY